MALPPLLTSELAHALDDDPQELRAALAEVHSEDIAAMLGELPIEQAAKVMQHLPVEQAAEVLERLTDEVRVGLLEHWKPETSAELITEMSPDERVDLVAGLPNELRQSILEELQRHEPEVAEETRVLASYPQDTAGGLMTTEYLSLGLGVSCERAIAEVRRLAREQNPELIYSIYVVNYGQLVGVVSLRDLILGEPHEPISNVMTENVVHVSPETDQEEVARTAAKYDLSAVPVVDASGQMLGVVTVDDLVHVVIEEATEDAQMVGAVVPVDKPYLEIGFLTFVGSRVTWLIVLFLGELVTANVMHNYEAEIATLMDLVLFVPLIISSGGNSGSQSSSLVIRALALGEVSPRDWAKVLWRELRVGIALGVLLSIVGFLRALLLDGDRVWTMGLIVGSSLVAVVALGTLVGSLMPLVIKRLGLDPAVASTPFVASLVDVLGLIVYFTVSRTVLAMGL